MKNIIEFLETYVTGKTLYTKELVYELENGSLRGIYSDQISFFNLKYSQPGFQFDMFIVSNEKIYALEKNKEHEEPRKDFSSVSLFRFELAKRKSTQAITGFIRFISASLKDVSAQSLVFANLPQYHSPQTIKDFLQIILRSEDMETILRAGV